MRGQCVKCLPWNKLDDVKYIELDFSQNLVLRPKDEVQSAHFSGKQLTLHYSIVNSVNNGYHFQLSDDTNHDSIFVDHVIRNIIDKYGVCNLKYNLWTQSDNVSSQYKNKYSFGLLNKLASEFNLRIIRTYGAARKGAIDGMTSFGVKKLLRKDIATHNVFSTKVRKLLTISK